jgi:hypothetical protein
MSTNRTFQRMALINGAWVSFANTLSADVAEAVIGLVSQVKTEADLDNFEALVEDIDGIAVIRQPKFDVVAWWWSTGARRHGHV